MRPGVSLAGALPTAPALRAWPRDPTTTHFEHEREAYHKWEWQRRLATYQLKASISEFTSTWARCLWHMDCPVLNPPCDSHPVEARKRNSILSVGSFSTGRHQKKQLEMVQLFGELRSGGLAELEYSCVGGVTESRPDDFEYFEQVRELGVRWEFKSSPTLLGRSCEPFTGSPSLLGTLLGLAWMSASTPS